MTCDAQLTSATLGIRSALAQEDLIIEGQLSGASNASLLCTIRLEIDGVVEDRRCVYKPRQGERPLWDFATGTLSRREVLADCAARMLGWQIVPPTVWRHEGPYGPGMCQEWIDDDTSAPAVDVFTPGTVPAGWHVIVEGRSYDGSEVILAHEDSLDLQRMAVFDLVINNADRKGGHILRLKDGHIMGIDHGLSFHEESKLRTVLWGWEGMAFPTDVLVGLHRMQEHLDHGCAMADELRRHLSVREFTALEERLTALLALPYYPQPLLSEPCLPWPPM